MFPAHLLNYALPLKTEPEPNKLYDGRQSKDSSTRTHPAARLFRFPLSVSLCFSHLSPGRRCSLVPRHPRRGGRRLSVSSAFSPRAQTPCSPPTFGPALITTWARVTSSSPSSLSSSSPAPSSEKLAPTVQIKLSATSSQTPTPSLASAGSSVDRARAGGDGRGRPEKA